MRLNYIVEHLVEMESQRALDTIVWLQMKRSVLRIELFCNTPRPSEEANALSELLATLKGAGPYINAYYYAIAASKSQNHTIAKNAVLFYNYVLHPHLGHRYLVLSLPIIYIENRSMSCMCQVIIGFLVRKISLGIAQSWF